MPCPGRPVGQRLVAELVGRRQAHLVRVEVPGPPEGARRDVGLGLGPAGQVLDVMSVDQPRLEAVLQEIERRPPVVAGRLHNHPGHPETGKPVAQRQHRGRHRGDGADLLHPLPARARHPRATDHLGLAHIQSRDPLDDLGLVGLGLHRPRLRTPQTEPGRPPVGAAGNGESDPRARSTRNGPQHSPRRPTSERPRTTRRLRRQRVAAHHFQPGTALPDRGQQDFRDTGPPRRRLCPPTLEVERAVTACPRGSSRPGDQHSARLSCRACRPGGRARVNRRERPAAPAGDGAGAARRARSTRSPRAPRRPG
jgi:hypothetical protein